MKIPFRCMIYAASGGGKSNACLSILAKMSDTFKHIFVCIPNGGQEPLYQFLQDKIGAKNITFFKKATEIPQMTKMPFTNEGQCCLIFDDMVNAPEVEQSVMREWFLRGRKCGKGMSLFFLTQSYFKTQKFIRLNTNYLIILKMGSVRDLRLILSDFNLGLKKEDLLAIYKDATKEKFNFLKIDAEADDDRKFSKNFTQFYEIES